MSEKTIPYKIYLEESELPTAWYNVRADMKKKPAPLLNGETHKPITAEELSPVFCDELIRQELDDTTAYFPIPDEIRDFYKMYRPAPLIRAEATSSIPLSRRLTTLSSRVFAALPPRRALVNGVRLSLWRARISDLTATYIWLNALTSRSPSDAR